MSKTKRKVYEYCHGDFTLQFNYDTEDFDWEKIDFERIKKELEKDYEKYLEEQKDETEREN